MVVRHPFIFFNVRLDFENMEVSQTFTNKIPDFTPKKGVRDGRSISPSQLTGPIEDILSISDESEGVLGGPQTVKECGSLPKRDRLNKPSQVGNKAPNCLPTGRFGTPSDRNNSKGNTPLPRVS